MGLRHWSGRRIGAMWTAVVVIEAAVAAVSAYQSRDIRAEMRKTERELHGNFADSLRDTRSGGLILHRTNPRADSLQDSVVKLLNRVFADSGVQGTLWAAANRASQAGVAAAITAALLLLLLPIATAGITLIWLWRRRRRDDLQSSQSAA